MERSKRPKEGYKMENIDKNTCKTILERLERDLKTKINRSHLHFYDKIHLVTPSREAIGGKNRRVYDEQRYVELRTAIILRKAGVPLHLIDALVNKCDSGAKVTVKEMLKEELRFIGLAMLLLG